MVPIFEDGIVLLKGITCKIARFDILNFLMKSFVGVLTFFQNTVHHYLTFLRLKCCEQMRFQGKCTHKITVKLGENKTVISKIIPSQIALQSL